MLAVALVVANHHGSSYSNVVQSQLFKHNGPQERQGTDLLWKRVGQKEMFDISWPHELVFNN